MASEHPTPKQSASTMNAIESRAYSRGYAAGRKRSGPVQVEEPDNAKAFAELSELMKLLEKRLRHTEIELAQARVSISAYKLKYEQCATWIKAKFQRPFKEIMRDPQS